jgi:hypothetical protein
MQNAYFLDIEPSSYDANGFPLSLSWSLEDGSIKTVLLMPDDAWLEDETSYEGVDIQHYLDQGVSGIDIIREMNEDLECKTVYFDGIDDDEGLLEKLCESFDAYIDFELMPITSYVEDVDEFHEMRTALLHEQGLDNQRCRDNVLALLLLSEHIDL